MIAAAGLSTLERWPPVQGLSGRSLEAQAMEAGVAAAITVALLALCWSVARGLNGPVSRLLLDQFGVPAEAVVKRLDRMMRRSLAALLLAMAAAAWPWQTVAALIVGVPLAAAVALLSYDLLRLVGLPRWLTTLLAVIAFFAVVGFSIGGWAPVGAVLERIGIDLGKRRITLLDVIAMLVTGLVLYAVVRLLIRFTGLSIVRAEGMDATQKLLAQKLSALAIIVIAFFVGVDLLGIDLTAFAVFSGALGLAVGFGLQKTFGNLIAGIILLMDRSVKPGDVIVVGDSFGMVNKIGVRAVSVVTRDGKEHLIPNEILMTTEVENWSFTDRNVRIRIPVVLPYDADVELAQSLMLKAAEQSARVLNSPKPTVWMIELQENGTLHEIRVWITDPESGLGPVKNDVLKRLLALFREHGLRTALPQRDIHIRPVVSEV